MPQSVFVFFSRELVENLGISCRVLSCRLVIASLTLWTYLFNLFTKDLFTAVLWHLPLIWWHPLLCISFSAMTCSFSRQRMMPESRELHAFKLMMLVCCPICSSVGKRRGGRGIGSISTYNTFLPMTLTDLIFLILAWLFLSERASLAIRIILILHPPTSWVIGRGSLFTGTQSGQNRQTVYKMVEWSTGEAGWHRSDVMEDGEV